MVGVIAIAYGSQAPRLAVAEFAPSANRALEAPPTTAGDPGPAGVGPSARRRPTTTSAPTTVPPSLADAVASQPGTTRVGRSRACFGNPPRQTEDPMSPPCAATIFEGDNGGGTSRGLSGTEIRVGIPGLSGAATDAYSRTVNALFEQVNQSFELYGRRLVPVFVPGDFSTTLTSRTAAAEVAAREVFGALTGYAEWQEGQASLPMELARQEVVTVVRSANTWWSDRTLFDALHPYVWSVYPSAEDTQINLGDFACRSLAGHVAAWAGDAPLKSARRRFGILSLARETPPSVTVLADRLAECAGQAPLRLDVTRPHGNAVLRTGLERLRSEGATTLICVCEAYYSESAMQGAHAVGFHPEWLITPSYTATGNDEHWVQPYRKRNEVAPMMRLSAGPRLLPVQARPWYGVTQQLVATGAAVSTVMSMAEFFHPQLLVLAAGIQGAGPMLTPDTFAAALMSMQFPNPGAGQAPYWQPSAGFGVGDHSFYDDFQVAWWSDTASALDTGLSPNPIGSWCYVNQGARFRPGGYPANADALMFNPAVPCR